MDGYDDGIHDTHPRGMPAPGCSALRGARVRAGRGSSPSERRHRGGRADEARSRPGGNGAGRKGGAGSSKASVGAGHSLLPACYCARRSALRSWLDLLMILSLSAIHACRGSFRVYRIFSLVPGPTRHQHNARHRRSRHAARVGITMERNAAAVCRSMTPWSARRESSTGGSRWHSGYRRGRMRDQRARGERAYLPPRV
jgi:hypothetical protein